MVVPVVPGAGNQSGSGGSDPHGNRLTSTNTTGPPGRAEGGEVWNPVGVPTTDRGTPEPSDQDISDKLQNLLFATNRSDDIVSIGTILDEVVPKLAAHLGIEEA